MPLKLKKKDGGTKYRTYNQEVGDLKKQGYSEERAKKITAIIQNRQERKHRKKSK